MGEDVGMYWRRWICNVNGGGCGYVVGRRWVYDGGEGGER